MKAVPTRDSRSNEYLSDISARDKPWDVNKALSQKVGNLLQGTIKDRLAGKIKGCGGFLEFGWVTDSNTEQTRLKITAAFLCHSRFCIVCQWRKSLVWTAKFLGVMPKILSDYPTSRFLFLTLTVKACEISELRSTINHLNKSWQRLSQRKNFPAIGFVRSTEVTRNWDVYYKGDYQGRMGTKTLNQWKEENKGFNRERLKLETTTEVKPHFHVLLMVQPGYFAGHSYMTQEDWTNLWQSCLRVDYPPVVDIRAVKPNKRWSLENPSLAPEQALAGAIVETVKYSVKPSDLIGEGTEEDQQWLLQLTKQLEHTKAIALGGVFKKYLSEAQLENPSNDDLLGKKGDDSDVSASRIYFGWREMVQRYVKVWED